MDLPYLTETPPIDGVYKHIAEDFVVEEIARVEPEGSGDHLWLRIEKRGLTTPVAVRRIAEALECDSRQASWAGMKDKHAVTRQWISVFGGDADRARSLELDGIEILEAHPHSRKLKTGTLRGNTFDLLVRGEHLDVEVVRTTMEQLTTIGTPNYFGTQRFGRDGSNVARARRWLIEGERAPRKRTEKRFLVSAFQSHAFNEVLGQRLRDGTLATALDGDVMRKVETGGVFVCTEPDVDGPRVRDWEVSPTGPMFGRKMTRAERVTGIVEAAVESEMGFDDAVYARMGKLGEGTRRPLRIRPTVTDVQPAPEGIRIRMTLPSGAYATVVLRELFKSGLREGSS